MNDDGLTNTMLFRGMGAEEIGAMLHCLGACRRSYHKGSTIYRAGEHIDHMGLVMAGGVTIEINDLWGNTTLLGQVEPGQLFAETYACLPGEPMMVSAVACEPSEILFLCAAKLLAVCPSACAHHSRLTQNLVQILAQKNLNFSRRSLHTAPKSIRGRLLSYLSEQANLAGSCQFTIPFNRQQLADYLGVDRSALSNELSKMRREGLLSCERSRFALNPGASPAFL